MTGTFGPDVDPDLPRAAHHQPGPEDPHRRSATSATSAPSPARSPPDRRSAHGLPVRDGRRRRRPHLHRDLRTSATRRHRARSRTPAAMRSMSWQHLDATANRQGVTIQEDGELGGPGFGGCPAAAAAQGPASPDDRDGHRRRDTTSHGDLDAGRPSRPARRPIVGYTVRAVVAARRHRRRARTRSARGSATPRPRPRRWPDRAWPARPSRSAASPRPASRWPPAVANKTRRPARRPTPRSRPCRSRRPVAASPARSPTSR